MSAELLGIPEHFRTRDFSHGPRSADHAAARTASGAEGQSTRSPATQTSGWLYPITSRRRARFSQSDSKIMERSGPSRVLLPPDKELPVPNTLQYPLERQRDVQRRWQQILQRTAAPRTIPPTTLKISALSSTHGKVESSGRNSPPRSRPDSTANVGRIRNG
jgi:hypothetical protein